MNNYPENDYRNYLEHSFLGTQWKKATKYLFKKNGRYYYPGDVAESTARSSSRNNSAYRTGSYDNKVSDSLRKNRVGRSVSRAANTLRSKATLATTRGKMAAKSKINSRLDRLRRTSAYKTADVARQKASSRLHSLGTSARIGVGNAKASARTAKRYTSERLRSVADKLRGTLNVARNKTNTAVGNAVTKAKFKARKTRIAAKNAVSSAKSNASRAATNANRQIYRKTGVNVSGTASKAKEWAAANLDTLKKKGKNAKRKAYRKTGISFLK